MFSSLVIAFTIAGFVSCASGRSTRRKVREDEAEALRQKIDGWSRHDGFLFKYFASHLNWDDAREKCKEEGANLVMPKTKSVNDFLISNWNGFWIGVSDKEQEGTFVFVDGTKVSVPSSYWSNHDDANNQDCVELGKFERSKWDDRQCEDKMPFVCQRENIVKSFVLVEHGMKWNTAKIECKERYGGELATKLTKAELESIEQKWIEKNGKAQTWYWVGAKSDGKPLYSSSGHRYKKFEWVDGGIISNQDGLWDDFQGNYRPNDNNDDDDHLTNCVMVTTNASRKDGSKGPAYEGWKCHYVFPSVCQIKK